MGIEFVCSIDGQAFSNKEDALTYMFSQHVKEKDGDCELEKMKIRLENEFPFYRFTVTKRPYTVSDAQHAEDGNPWFEGKEIYFINPSTDLYALQGMQFTICDKHKYDHDEQNVFERLDAAILFYKRFISGAALFAKSVLEEVKKHDSDVIDCVVTKIEQTYGTADSFNEYHISLLHSNGTKRPCGYIELDTRDLQSNAALESQIKHYVKSLSGRYVTSIEGEVTIGTPKYCNDHRTWYEVDGIAINLLAGRAKNLRVEILD
jgi:hypothetical protein